MSETTTYVIIGAMLVVVILFLVRYGASGEAEISLWDRIRLRISGRSRSVNSIALTEQGSKVRNQTIVGGDIVRGDKVTINHTREGARPRPEMYLRLIDRKGDLTDNVTVHLRGNALPDQALFRVGLQNNTTEVPARGIGIRLEVHWRGPEPRRAFRLFPGSRPNGWVVESGILTNEQPIVLTLNSSTLLVFHGQPLQWQAVRISVAEQVEGHFLLSYRVSSQDPPSDTTGELVVQLDYI